MVRILFNGMINDSLLDEMLRIVKVDLKFPARPFVSAQAKDLISQVNIFIYS